MAPLLPSESAAYALTLPEGNPDERLNLNVRTGAALVYTNTSVVVHGGLVIGLGLQNITIPQIQEQLEQYKTTKPLSDLISNELFYLNVINRQWLREQSDQDQVKPTGRFFHSIAFHGNSLYVFGGLTFDKETNEIIALNDLWEYSVDIKLWNCIDDGSSSGAVARYDHSTHIVDYISPFDNSVQKALAITGGRGELNQPLTHIALFDLTTKTYVGNTEMGLSLHELSLSADSNEIPEIAPKEAVSSIETKKLKAVSESSFVMTASSNPDSSEGSDDVFHIISTSDDSTDENPLNPIVSLRIAPNASGLRLPLAVASQKTPSVIPNNLKYPTGGIFGSNVIVSGHNTKFNEFQVYLYNKPSRKWTRLNIDTKKKASELYLWKSFSWPSHHKVLVLGSVVPPENAAALTVQTFGLIVLVGLPITNIFHAFAPLDDTATDANIPKFTSLKENTSFEAYSKYIAPKTQISSIRSVFPNYAVALGRNAFERYGSSLSDFDLVTADGDKVSVPLMLLRKRWGRCFDMLLAKAYARAVYKLESEKEEDPEDNENSDSNPTSTAKKSRLVMNKTPEPSDNREIPEFRLPFQDKLAPTSSNSSHAFPGSAGPTSRKASVVSNGASSLTSASTTDGVIDDLDLDNLPPQLPLPNEPLPSLEKPSLKSIYSRDYLRDSPRGSISGASFAGSSTIGAGSISGSNNQSTIRLQDLRTSVASSRKKQTSRQASVQTATTDDTSVSDLKSTLESVISEFEDDTTAILEPLLVPRSLYMPFATATVSALSEFMYTGQLGDKWLLTPTTTDNFLIAKFYEIPLLYDLISEALYAIIGKKEEALIKEYGELLNEYQSKLNKIFKDDKPRVESFFLEHPHVRESFNEIESFFSTVDDGFLNLTLLRRSSKASTAPSTPSGRSSVNNSRRHSSIISNVRPGKSSLSKEVKEEDSNGYDDLDNEEEDDAETLPPPPKPITSISEDDSIKQGLNKFKTDTLTSSNNKRASTNIDEDLDPLSKSTASNTPYTSGKDDLDTKSIHTRRSEYENLDEDDPLAAPSHGAVPIESSESENVLQQTVSKTKSESGSGDDTFQVPEGRFAISKDQVKQEIPEESTSDNHKESTSDSDDMAVGLGLVSNLKLKEKKKRKSTDEQDGNSGEDDEDDDSYENLPTLANLASPTSAPPGDHLLQVIFETAALACDMKLLLRSVNVLEMSRIFARKKVELLKELDDYDAKFGEQRLKEEVLLKEKEKEQREKENAAKASQVQKEKQERERVENAEKSKTLDKPQEQNLSNTNTKENVKPVPTEEKELSSRENKKQNVQKTVTPPNPPKVPDSPNGKTFSRPTDTASISNGELDGGSSDASSATSRRSRFASFKSLTSLNRPYARSEHGRDDASLRSHNPFIKRHTHTSGESKRDFFSFMSRKPKPSSKKTSEPKD